MKAQFLHVDYAKRIRERHPGRRRSGQDPNGSAFRSAGWSAVDLLSEAARVPEHCPHVPNPQPPIVHQGVAPMDVLPIIDEWVRAQHKLSKTAERPRGRRYPKNRPVVAVGVISYPRDGSPTWPSYRDACIRWLQQRYGARLRSVVEHVDEGHPHLHYVLVPLNDEGFEAVHEGYAAQLRRRRAFFAATGTRGKGERLGTYRMAAMRALQDTFHREVAAHFSLARTGPKRLRTSYEDARRRRIREEEEAGESFLASWHGERQAEQEAERAALLLNQIAWAESEHATDGREEIDHRNALWELAKDAVNTVWKIGEASDIDAVKECAQALVTRYNTLVEQGRAVNGRFRRLPGN